MSLRKPFFSISVFITLGLLLFTGTACTRIFYASMKKLGREKRDILVSRIVDAKKAETEASEQFKTALEAFQSVTQFSGGDIEKAYNKLNDEMKDAQGRANKVSDRIQSIDKVSKDLFKEWSGEIDQMSDGKLKNESRVLLRGSEQRQTELLRQMRVSEAKMKPVLQKLFDQVIFLKSNLNARAISSLKTHAASIDSDVTDLIKEIEKSNAEADKAIAGLTAASEP